MSPAYLLIAFAMSFIICAVSVLLGGLLVYRTKRESHEPFMKLRGPRGTAFSLDPFVEPEEDTGVQYPIPEPNVRYVNPADLIFHNKQGPLPDIIERANDRARQATMAQQARDDAARTVFETEARIRGQQNG